MATGTLINLLAPPGGDLPQHTGARIYATPGGGRLYMGIVASEGHLNAWLANSDMEVWKTTRAAATRRAHIYGCGDYAAFKEVCASLVLARLGILQIAMPDNDHTMMLLAGEADTTAVTMQMRPLAERLGIDIAIIGIRPAPSLSVPGCLFMDMDSTLIRCECIDELADFLGIRREISAITLRAMEGELDFAASLTKRVALLAGLDASVLDRVYEERIRLTRGAERLISTLHGHGWKVGLVSGGFRHFTDRLMKRLHLDFSLSNTLEIRNGKLTGAVLGSIVDASAKRAALIGQAESWGIPMEQTVAIGDGANDLPMLAAAGFGIAFHAKPKVRELAPYSFTHGGLERILDLLA